MLEKLGNLLSGGRLGAKKAEEEARIVAEALQRDIDAKELADKKKALAKEKRDAKKAEKLKKQAEEEAKKQAEEEAKKQAEEAAKKNSPKEIATAAGEPWVQVLNVELDKDNLGAGAFELDWNDIFVARLFKSGYQGKTDADVVDNWFLDVCRHVVLETYQQEQADPEKRANTNASNRKDLGDGKAEFS